MAKNDINANVDLNIGERLAYLSIRDGLTLPVKVRLPFSMIKRMAAIIIATESDQEIAASLGAMPQPSNPNAPKHSGG